MSEMGPPSVSTSSQNSPQPPPVDSIFNFEDFANDPMDDVQGVDGPVVTSSVSTSSKNASVSASQHSQHPQHPGLFDDIDVALVPFVGADDDADDFDEGEDGPEAVPVPGNRIPADDSLNADCGNVLNGDEATENALTPNRHSRAQLSGSLSKAPAAASSEISLGKAAFHIFKGNVGAAVFSLSLAYLKSGFVMGSVIIIFTALVCVHCMMMLVKIKQKINNPNVNTYGQVACAAFGRPGKHLVDIFIVITQLGFCCVYYQFAAGLLHGVLGISVTALIAMMIPATTLPTFLPSMKTLIPAAMFASFATVVSLVIVYGYSLDNVMSKGFDERVTAIAPAWGWPVCIGNAISAFEGIGLVLPIENSLKKKEEFPKLLSQTFLGISALYVTFGLAGYCAYAHELDNSITNVLPEKEFASGTVRVSMAFAILMTFPLQFFPAIQVIEGWTFERKSRYLALQSSLKGVNSYGAKLGLIWKNLLLRTLISSLLAMLAILVGDQMSVFLALIGGMGGSALAVIIPPLLHLRVIVYSNEAIQKGISKFHATKDVLIILVGVFLGVISTYVSFVELLTKLGETEASGSGSSSLVEELPSTT